MKKLSILIGLVFFGLATTTAQTFEKGDNVANLTVGFGPGNNSGAGYTSGIAFGLSVEHCFWDDLINEQLARHTSFLFIALYLIEMMGQSRW